MKKGKKNTKLDKFGKLTKAIMDLGFESMFVVAVEKNEGEEGKTFLSSRHHDPDEEARYEKNIIKLVTILGTKPKELKSSLGALTHLSTAGQLHQLQRLLEDGIGDLEKLVGKKKKKKKSVKAGVDTITFRRSGAGMPRPSRAKELLAETKLGPEDRVKLLEIRERKNALVKKRDYENAAKARDEERELLGLNNTGIFNWTFTG